MFALSVLFVVKGDTFRSRDAIVCLHCKWSGLCGYIDTANIKQINIWVLLLVLNATRL